MCIYVSIGLIMWPHDKKGGNVWCSTSISDKLLIIFDHLFNYSNSFYLTVFLLLTLLVVAVLVPV